MDKSFCSINSLKVLYDRVNFLFISNKQFPNITDNNNTINKEDFRDLSDIEWMKEIDISISKEIKFMLAEGNELLNLDEFGAKLFENFNPNDLCCDFPIRTLGTSRFILGWVNSPPIEHLIKKMGNFHFSIYLFIYLFDKYNW